MVTVGAALVVVGVGTLAVYVLYLFFNELYTAEAVPIVFKVATPVALVGFVLLVAAVVMDRLRKRGREHFEEVEN